MREPSIAEEGLLLLKLGTPGLFYGVTTTAQRRERIREQILAANLADEDAEFKSMPGTWREAFRTVYGEEL